VCTDDHFEWRILLLYGRHVIHPLHHQALSLVCIRNKIKKYLKFLKHKCTQDVIPLTELSSMFWLSISTTSSFLSVSTTWWWSPSSQSAAGESYIVTGEHRNLLGVAGCDQSGHAAAGPNLQHALASDDVRIGGEV
jgi:hypothetical protein